MIPRRLTLQNFLSYRDVTLDFRGLHVACICGPNGAGKSSLLEAIAWAVWGQSRVAAEDDIVYLGAAEAKVDFIFEHGQQTYRILRSRRRNQSSFLEFQIETESGFRALTQRGIRATQLLILQHLKIDYDTFVNSAYLRQGRADEFMLKRPSERKQTLADLLKLDHYDRLAEQAKAQARDYKAQAQLLETHLAQLDDQLQQREAISANYACLQKSVVAAQAHHQAQQQQLATLQTQQRQRQTWQQALALAQQQYQHDQQAFAQLQQTLESVQARHDQLQALLVRTDEITAGYRVLQQLTVTEEQVSLKFQAYQLAQEKRAQLQQQKLEALGHLESRYQSRQLRLEALDERLETLQQMIDNKAEVEAAWEQLQQARQHLQRLDQQQLKVAPLRQRQQQLQTEIDRATARLSARLDEMITTQQQLQTQQQVQPQLRQAVRDISHRLSYLEQRRTYQEQVRLKGQERRSFMERLQADQRNYEVQLAQIDQKIKLLAEPHAVCPLCDRPLQEHGQRVMVEQQQQRQEVQDQIWVIREQLAVSEREIQVLRQEYREIEGELSKYADVLQQRGHLQAQLESSATVDSRLQTVETERANLERCLQGYTDGDTLHRELEALEQSISTLNYDDRDHALARNQVEKLRWVEAKRAELRQAERQLAECRQQRPVLKAELKKLQQQIEVFEQHPLAQQLIELDRHIADMDYNLTDHQQLREQLREARPWQLQYQAWQAAQQRLPDLEQQLSHLKLELSARQSGMDAIAPKIQQLQQQLAENADPQAVIANLAAQLQVGQAQREAQLAQLGRLEQQLVQLDQVQAQVEQQRQARQQAHRKQQVYQTLAQSFGKNGIQALMIENLLPQLEAETNQILGRLSAHQLHVQFVTQRVGRSRKKLIDTLDILIADARGTRAYETYSGGEAFRVNFAIRLALARLLAQRSGMALQMLIIDEGFGTQDKEGCDRLIAAINAIAPDFACILSVTHMPHFREAFQTRIDVSKTERGSQIEISG
ncbi:MAG: SMC family ATPase [Cyanobacteria bacterium P01_G01_bin.38]